jgi:hypothetical protein
MNICALATVTPAAASTAEPQMTIIGAKAMVCLRIFSYSLSFFTVSFRRQEVACQPAIATATAVVSAVGFVIHGIGMFALFTKMNKVFNSKRIAANLRHQQRIRKQR